MPPPGHTHEMPLEMTQRNPGFALELLAIALGVAPDGYRDPRIESVDLTERLPAEYRADKVVSVLGYDGDRRFLILEVQRSWDPNKIWTWPAYIGGLMGRHHCAVILIVFCTDNGTADRYDRPIYPTDSCVIVRPIVVRPKQLPSFPDGRTVHDFPELATLSAIAHHDDHDHLVKVAAALVKLKDERGIIYYDYLCGELTEPARARLEDAMTMIAPMSKSRFLRPIEERAEARAEPRGEARGRLLGVLDIRNITLTPKQQDMVTACKDVDQLQTWAQRAKTATTADEIFEDDD